MNKSWIALLLTYGLFSLVSADEPEVRRPNIVLMMSDDQGWGETGYNGHPDLQTPVLDAMARDGLRMDRFYAASSVCSPTRTSVLTGRHANRSGVFSWNYCTRPEEITLPQIVQQAGYRTGHFGKWHVGPVKAASPVNPRQLGFDEYLSHDNFFELDPPLSHNGAAPEVIRGESSEIIIDSAIEFAERAAKAQQPFLIIVWFGSPHGPYSGLDEDVALYDKVSNEEMRRRFAEITAMDRAIGKFRNSLRDLDIAENTLVWFNSDNGTPIRDPSDSFNGGLNGKKGGIYEGSFQVPAVIEWPAVIKIPRVTDVPCVTSDILPTLLDILGLRHPTPDRPIDGISLRGLIESDSLSHRPSPIGFWKYDAKPEKANARWLPEELTRGTTPTTSQENIDFTNFRHPFPRTQDFGGEAAWTDNRYKLISRRGKRDATEIELYDLQLDPYETNNIAVQHPQVVALMTAQLHAWQKSVELSLSGADYLPNKQLPLPAEYLCVNGCPAFIIPANQRSSDGDIPWVWYAPTLPKLPAEAERWMFEQFLQAGIAIAGIDVGESYGNPAGRANYSEFYNYLTSERRHSTKPIMLARSRGGLMALSWAVENADKVGGFAGIYPVCNIASYPNVDRASAAYGLLPAELNERLSEHNPVDRLAPLANARVPLFAIHGDVDTVVPLEENSGLLRTRYENLGGTMQLVVPPGQGHTMWEGFFHCQELVSFVIEHAR